MTSEFGIAVHAMVFLHHKGDMVSSEVLAENICTNPARVRKVMAKLKKAGLVDTKEGAVGGYQSARAPETVTLCEIAEALGERFVCSSWHSGGKDLPCLVASGMAGVMDALYQELDTLCRQRLSHITLADVEYAENWGGVIKLIGQVKKQTSGKLQIIVCPMFVPVGAARAGC